MENKRIKIFIAIIIALILLTVLFLFLDPFKKSQKITGTYTINLKNDQNKIENEKDEVKKEILDAQKEKVKQHNELLLEIIELRKNHIQGKLIKTAQKISSVNKNVNDLENTKIIKNWESIMLCLAKSCDDKDFIEFILKVTLEENIINGEIILGISEADIYWNTDKVVKFSEAIIKVNTNIGILDNTEISEKWSEIIACDGICSEKEQLFFDMVELIAIQE